jgi:hypothetical protein
MPVLLVVLAMSACSNGSINPESSPTQPQAALSVVGGERGFMPMTPGNRWVYDGTLTTTVIPEGGAPDPPVVEPWSLQRGHVRYDELDDHTYMLEREVYQDAVGYSIFERHVRQDRSGYYLFTLEVGAKNGADRPVLSSPQRDRAAQLAARYGAEPTGVEELFSRAALARRTLRGLDPPAQPSPPGGATPNEITTLAYPLHVGATWVIRDEPLLIATVEAHEQYHGYPAWRVRIDNEFFGENDVAYAWYSRCGEIGTYSRVERLYVDESGTVLGTMILEDAGTLVESEIQRGGCDVARGGGGGVEGAVRSYPFEPGNRWTYRVTTRVGDDPSGPTTIVDNTQERWVEVDGRTYMKEVIRPRSPFPWTSLHYMRGDRDGLFRLEPPQPPQSPERSRMRSPFGVAASGAVGLVVHEAAILEFPLKVGASWTVRDTPERGRWTATVEARELVQSPAGEFRAFRIQLRHAQNPDDETIVWYGPEGLVKAYDRVQLDIGPVEETWELIELDLR